MCGIAGRFARDGAGHGLSAGQRARVLECLEHRGPDAAGEFDAGNVWLGHRRLSILDLSDAGCQPMSTVGGRYVLTYNGEIYNFMDLARTLTLDNLRSHSDTEVLLRAFALQGPAVFTLLNGIFAFALYDTHTKKAWLVRDRLGVKPLQYQIGAGRLSFGSEAKALLAMSEETPACNVAALHEWTYFGTTLGEQTLYAGTQRLLPGHYLELDLATWSHTIREYWSPAAVVPATPTATPKALIDQTRAHLDEAVRRQLVSDVPVGIMLSGGIDSSAITAFATRHYPGRIATYAAGFDFENGPNELAKARSVAAHFGTDHHEMSIGGVDMPDVIEKMVHHHDAPFGDAANIPLFLMGQRVRQSATVVLQGDGGDEMFGGYRRYSTLSRFTQFRALAAVGTRLNRLTPAGLSHERRARYFDALLERDRAVVMARLLTADGKYPDVTAVFSPSMRRRVAEHDPFARYRACQALSADRPMADQMMLIDTMIILPDTYFEKVDRAMMASSIEARVPFLDNDLVDFCLRLPASTKIPGGRRKWLLKAALEGVVPEPILKQQKLGFGVPFGFWLEGALKNFFHDHAARFARNYPDVLDRGYIEGLYRQQLARAHDHAFLLWKVLNFMIWANARPVSL